MRVLIYMTERQRKILGVIVKEYVESPKPVSSKFLAQKLKPELSSATIRNEMMELEKSGYIQKPHTSGGRIPTEKAYRIFIKSLEGKEVKVPIKVNRESPDETFKRVTQILAEMSGGLAFGGIKGLNNFFQSGLSNLLREPEFEDRDCFSEIAGMMEEFENHFDEIFKEISESETRVFIGHENPLKKTKKLSLIVSGCKTSGKRHGVIGLLGPMRMKYDYNISLINKIRELMENYE